jgi:hypothetical protein
MACRDFEKCVTIRASADAIYAELTQPERQIGLQPLLTRVAEHEQAATGSSRTFVAVEAVRLIPGWTVHDRIEVRIEPTRPGEVVEFHARSPLRIRVHSRFTLEPQADGTRVHESVRIEAPRLLCAFVARRAEAAQGQLLENLERRLEQREGAA